MFLTVAASLVPSWQVDASEVSRATPQQIWRWYEDSERTPNWDHLVTSRKINGPFETGTTGSNQGASGPAFPWVFTDVATNQHYTEVTRLPLATLTATHVLTPTHSGTRIDHALIVAGPLAWVYRLTFKPSFESGIHAALHRLAVGAAMGPPPALSS
ncbi:SRPBCC family protein [Anthocerotibacter panamensis]|uniref:SRPBCC family protein n=1 Tax=Anthocerotibacter panamensis TaxID=2857077 RepID=UPI001C4042E0|nr:SRPBCC family protein [Anthocerotibacter panamensis]